MNTGSNLRLYLHMCKFMCISLWYTVFRCRLLDLMAGRKDPSGLSGHLLVNGAKQPKNFMHMTGYVVQVRAVH